MGASGKNEEVIVERLGTIGASNAHLLGLDIETLGGGKDELKSSSWIFLESSSDGLKEVVVGDLSREQAPRRGHVPVEMGIWGDQGDLEGTSLGRLLENAVRCADAGVGGSENDDVLHGHGFRMLIWRIELLKLVRREEIEDDGNSLLESTDGESKKIKHCSMVKVSAEQVNWKSRGPEFIHVSY